MGEQLEGATLILSELESEVVLRAIEVSGYRFKDEGLVYPDLDPDQKLEIPDQTQAKLLVACLERNASLSDKLLEAHKAHLSRVYEYQLPIPSRTQLDRIRNSMDTCVDRSRAAKTIGSQIIKFFEIEQ